MNKIFNNPDYKANIGYNGFDMSQLIKFTSTTGELLPVYYDILQPGDKVNCSTELKTRTLPLESPVMCSINEIIDWFFVPIEQIYKLFGSFYYRVDDSHSSLFDPTYYQDDIPKIQRADQVTLVNAMAQNWMYFSGANASDFRLSDLLDFPFYKMLVDGIGGTVASAMDVCPLTACAYQKIYMDYYRLPDREAPDTSAYSLDKYYATKNITATDAHKMFTLRYRPYKKDFMTNLFTSPLYGEQSLSGYDRLAGMNEPPSELLHNWVTEGTDTLTLADMVDNPDNVNPSQLYQDTAVNLSGTTTQQLQQLSQAFVDLSSKFSPSALRTSFAIQKFLEITRRSGKHVDAQQLAHFGVKLPNGISGEVKYLGSAQSVIHIGDVVATADTINGTAGQPLGAQAGKGYGYGQGSNIQFTAPTHGVLMAIYSAVPEVDYGNYCLDRSAVLFSREEWPTPEFDNLGMQPLFGYQISYDGSSPTNMSAVVGWQYRYSEWKTKYNKVRGGLRSSRNLAFWTTQRDTLGNNLNNFLVDPFFLNPVMTVGYAPLLSDPWNSDPLIHELFVKVNKASKMSTYGLESL